MYLSTLYSVTHELYQLLYIIKKKIRNYDSPKINIFKTTYLKHIKKKVNLLVTSD